MRGLALIATIFLANCAHDRVAESVAETSKAEGQRYAREVASQSLFETVEITWSEAARRMQSRNPQYIRALESITSSTAETDLLPEMAGTVKDAVSSSIGDVIKPSALIETLSDPVAEIPKRIGSLASIKDLPHQLEQDEWKTISTTVKAQWTMRTLHVQLHRLLQEGELIDTEVKRLNSAQPPIGDSDPKVLAAMGKWHAVVHGKRATWLEQVRDIFDAQYHDARFIPDGTGLTMYREIERPDLGDWRRWAKLQRTRQMVDALGEKHSREKPAIPGSKLITGKLKDMVEENDVGMHQVRDAAAVRSEVRSLAKHWQLLKAVQKQAAKLEKKHRKDDPDSPIWIAARQKIFELRLSEIQYASAIWMSDETCWVAPAKHSMP